ncbi:hypothetical protein [uncultured Sphingomonas sp.]|uniref:hypothetical protein n=1 Tax=uncultured Sphingomonas sp. TaxID=158754 RepID=UPI0025E4589F|nr:hypothetical protein [uncultured Sphingomonas sp.]
MTSTTSAGTRLFISAALPAAETKAGYEALAWTEITGVQTIPAFGPSVGENSYQPLNGPEEVHKGPVSYGSLTVPYAYDKQDAGQAMLRQAAKPGDNALRSFKVQYPNNDARYNQGRVFSATEEPGSATNVVMGSALIRFSKQQVDVDAA